MDPFTLLRSDHDKVKALLNEADDASGDEKARLVTIILEELELHAKLEEQVFYPAGREASEQSEEYVLEGIEEHDIAEDLIAELRGMTPSEETFDAKVKVLKDVVEHHIEEEEGQMFPSIRAAMEEPEQRELARRMLDWKVQNGGDEVLIDLTKDALYEIAQDRGVEGRADMSKDELIAALRGAS